MKKFSILFSIILASLQIVAQNNTIKNVIVMIPDGTSSSVLSLTRKYNRYVDSSNHYLNIDPFLCGFVQTHSSNAPIGDSAPTSSWYSTGESSQTGFIATYPPSDPKNDLEKKDPTRAYQPLMTILEASKLSGKSTGLVFTCQFPHATPSDFSAHYHDRGSYEILAKQMMHNNIDVVFGGGTKFLSGDSSVLKERGFRLITNNLNDFRKANDKKLWALFAPVELPYDWDRNKEKSPSLEEMTEKALDILSQNNQGFFLMIEGSKVDWAAHANDPTGIVSEFAAFDKAVGKVIDFAKRNGNTAVVIMPDHGNSGLSLGNHRSNKGYDTLSIHSMMHPLVACKMTCEGLTEKIADEIKKKSIQYCDSSFIAENFKKFNSEIILNADEIKRLMKASDTLADKINGTDKKAVYKASGELSNLITEIFNSRTYFGFTTHGHTAEDVFLAAYSPSGNTPRGLQTNGDINDYLCLISGMKGSESLADSTRKYFAPHNTIFKGVSVKMFKNDSIFEWNASENKFIKGKKFLKASLMMSKNYKISGKDIVFIAEKDKTVLEIPAYTNILFVNGNRQSDLKSVSIYSPVTQLFYLQADVIRVLK